MLPGKKYSPEDVIKILRKRFWVLAVPWALFAAATAGAARKLPDLYKSRALIQVIPPQVPDSIVRPIAPVPFDQRLQATQQAILSRTRLESIIQEFQLYKAERKTQLMEEVVDNMRKDIKVTPTKGDSFTVEYIGREPVTVMKVTERLAGYFKDESVQAGVTRAEGTNAFIDSEVEDSHRKLVEIEDRLKKYRMSHAGEMPEQLGANMQAVNGISMNLNAVRQALQSDANQKTTIEHLIEAAQNPETQVQSLAAAAPVQGGAEVPVTKGTAAEQLLAAKNQLDFDLHVRKLGNKNPIVTSLNAMIVSLQKQVDDEAQHATVSSSSGAAPTGLTAADKARAANLQNLQTELDGIKARIANNQAEEKRLVAAQASYQAKIDSMPLRDAELVEVTREYDTQKKIYNDNLAKREVSSMSVKLEQRQIGEQFSLLDPARVPERPFSPDRMMYNLMGIVGGLGIGLALVGFLEYRDVTFKADYEVASVLSLPVLAVVPLMQSDAERRAAFRTRLLVNLGLGSTVMVCLAVLAYTFVR